MSVKCNFINRELSWIEFNARVLNEATRKDIPLLERLNFLSITASNFDEFFQVRVASIKREEKQTPRLTDDSGLSRTTLLEKISERCHELTRLRNAILNKEILLELSQNGFNYIKPSSFTEAQKSFAESFFRHDIFPVLTPLRADGENFPKTGSSILNIAFLLERIKGMHSKETPLNVQDEAEILALVPVPQSLNSVIYLPTQNENEKISFTLLEDIISEYGTELFPGFNVKEKLIFKVSRDADLSVNEDAGEKFIQAMEEVLIKRKSSFAVRMICNETSETLIKILTQKLELTDRDIYKVNGIVFPGSLSPLTKLEEAQSYLYPAWKHLPSQDFSEEESYWNIIRQKDVLLNVPYQSYEPVVKFIQNAANDEQVLAIKITLYRTGNNSPIIKALEDAAKNGKQVTAFVELKARFDEERNISWASELENAGVIVIYGVVNLKVHAKLCLIIRKESDGIRRYLHLSTGNYNPKTAKTYSDLSLFTSNHDIVQDATLFFNVISGYSAVQTMHHIAMAPVTLKTHLIELIDREIKQSTPEHPGLIMAKMNSLCHKEIIEKLYEASQKGVRILLNIRGICTLVPGVTGMSENIKVISIIDRYLEHSRIYYFQNGGSEELYLSSADWMERNLDRRIELMFPILDSEVFKSIKKILKTYFKDNTHSHELKKDGTWQAIFPGKKEEPLSAQEELYRHYKKLSDAKKQMPKAEFSVRRFD